MRYFPHCHSCFLAVLFVLISPVLLEGQSSTSDFKPSGKVWGYAFGDFYYKVAGDTATWSSRAEYSGVPAEVYAFAIRRMYLGYDYNISPRFSTSVLLEGGDGILTLRGERSVYIKALNLRWKNIYPQADLVIGQMSTLAFSHVVEKIWNYRSIEKTIVDQRSIRSSSDMGVAVYGSFDSLGNYGYNLMIGNGNGTRPEDLSITGRHKIFSGEIYTYLMDRKIVLDLYGDVQTGPDSKNNMLIKGFAGYLSDPITLGVEILSYSQQKFKSDQSDTRSLGVSIFARSVLIKDKLNAFARYDSYNPDQLYRETDVPSSFNISTMQRNYDEQFFVAGLDFTPHKNVHIMPNIWVNSYSPKAEDVILAERQADIVPRITFYFLYR